MKIKYPDYKNSLLALTSSVLKYYNVETTHESLPCFDKLLEKGYKNVVVMVFDGMGTEILERHLNEEDFLRQKLIKTISSVFPPTTTAATTSLMTGLSPAEHGWLGWNLYFEEIGKNVDLFPNTLSGSDGKLAANYNVAKRCLPYDDIFDKINESSNGEVNAIYVSPFSSYNSKSIDDICNTVKSLCAEDGCKYIYTYWPQPDYDMHDYGTKHEFITFLIKSINEEVERMCDSLWDTLVIVTADHGLVDTKWRFIPDYPDVARCLLRKPSIETRAMAFFIKDGMCEEFEMAFNKHFGDCYLLLSKEKVIEKGLFGTGTPHSRLLGFIGDYLAIATKKVSIDCGPSTQNGLFKAAHAGLTDHEMNVPFIAVECN